MDSIIIFRNIQVAIRTFFIRIFADFFMILCLFVRFEDNPAILRTRDLLANTCEVMINILLQCHFLLKLIANYVFANNQTIINHLLLGKLDFLWLILRFTIYAIVFETCVLISNWVCITQPAIEYCFTIGAF
jgi:hypothetical protein